MKSFSHICIIHVIWCLRGSSFLSVRPRDFFSFFRFQYEYLCTCVRTVATLSFSFSIIVNNDRFLISLLVNFFFSSFFFTYSERKLLDGCLHETTLNRIISQTV